MSKMKLLCPTCEKELRLMETSPQRPFCSERCKMIDLGRWLDESYRVSRPANPDDIEPQLN